jgi:methionyl-tRNA formyltransferase
MKLQASAVKQVALKHNIPVAQPLSLKLDGKYPEEAAAAKAQIEAVQADVMVVAAYGLILPQWTLDAPPHGCLNIHASLLPRWRGAAPIHRAIETGDAQTGITIMQMDAGLDTGAMLLKEAIPIIHDGAAADTTQTLHDKLAVIGGSLIQSALQSIEDLEATPQADAGVTYAAKISKAESAIDWSMDAAAIERKIRALNPAPGCTTELNGEVVKVFSAQVVSQLMAKTLGMNLNHTPGKVIQISNAGIAIQTGNDVLLIREVQRAGSRRMSSWELSQGFPISY